MTLDRRLTLARPGLASSALEGLLRAERFAEPATRQVVVPVAGLYAAPDAASEQDDQALFGELVEVMEVEDGWAWGQVRRDGYVGYLRAETLGPVGDAPTHWVAALRAYAFEGPSIKARAIGPFSLNALMCINATDGAFLHAIGAGWLPARHLRALGDVETDFVAVAERLMGTPYLWGGRDSLGLDCSGLLQLALYACGRACPRDADMQAALGEDAPPDALRRGDLVFWPDHVGIMTDETVLLHANAFHMGVATEPLAEAVTRNASSGKGEPTAFRRLSSIPGA